jgi:hypothetical protein
MTFLFWVSYGVLWLVLAVLVVLVMLLYRQFGLMIMPGGRRISYGGLDVGARAPVLPLRLHDRTEIAYDWTVAIPGRQAHEATLALFAMPGCPLCDQLATDEATALLTQNFPSILLTQNFPSIQFLWIEGKQQQDHAVSGGWAMALSREGGAHHMMEIPGTPFVYLVSDDARILGKGLVNHPSDIDTLITEIRNGGNAAIPSERVFTPLQASSPVEDA